MEAMRKDVRFAIESDGVPMTPTAIVAALGAVERALGGAESVVMDFNSDGIPVDADEELPALTLKAYTVWVPRHD